MSTRRNPTKSAPPNYEGQVTCQRCETRFRRTAENRPLRPRPCSERGVRRIERSHFRRRVAFRYTDEAWKFDHRFTKLLDSSYTLLTGHTSLRRFDCRGPEEVIEWSEQVAESLYQEGKNAVANL